MRLTHAGEEQGPQRGVDDVHDAVPDEDAEDGEEDEHDQADDEHAPARGEVVLGLWGKKKGGLGGVRPQG